MCSIIMPFGPLGKGVDKFPQNSGGAEKAGEDRGGEDIFPAGPQKKSAQNIFTARGDCGIITKEI